MEITIRAHILENRVKHYSAIPEKTEQNLLIQAKQGDLQAYREIFETHKKRIFAVALGLLNNSHWAEDVTQEVFVRLYRSISKYDTKRKFFTYLYQITVNVCRDILNREKKRQSDSIDQENHRFVNIRDESQAGPVEKVEQNEIRDIIQQLLQRVGQNQRTVFLLRDVEGLEAEEIARILKCRKSTVRTHLHFARKALRKMIEIEYPELLEM